MSELIDDLLLLSRVSRSELRRAPLDVGADRGAIVAELRRRDPGREVEVRDRGRAWPPSATAGS